MKSVARRVDGKLARMRRGCSSMAIRAGKRLVESILRKFERMEKAARVANRRAEFHHVEECWLTVYEAFYGSFRVPLVPVAVEATKAGAIDDYKQRQTERRQAPWFKEMQSRPMRRVESKKVLNGQMVLRLDCGHTVCTFNTCDSRRHVRCRDCADRETKADKLIRKLQKRKKGDRH